jgi:hypothetical protein
MESSNQLTQEASHEDIRSGVNSDFSSRLRCLIGDASISAFGRKVDIGESLIRKYLKGSDPGLSKVVKVAAACEVDIRWLALGEGEIE